MPPLQAVTYTVCGDIKEMVQDRHVVNLLLHTTNKKYHMACQFVPFPFTLNDLKGHRQLQDLSMQFNEHFCDISHGFN